MMKKMALLAMIAMASSVTYAAPTPVCDGRATSYEGTAIPSTTDGSLFVVAGFTPQCSANSHVTYDQNQTAFWVGSASAKGKNTFGGSSNGGGVGRVAECADPTVGCTANDAGAALAAKAPTGS